MRRVMRSAAPPTSSRMTCAGSASTIEHRSGVFLPNTTILVNKFLSLLVHRDARLRLQTVVTEGHVEADHYR